MSLLMLKPEVVQCSPEHALLHQHALPRQSQKQAKQLCYGVCLSCS